MYLPGRPRQGYRKSPPAAGLIGLFALSCLIGFLSQAKKPGRPDRLDLSQTRNPSKFYCAEMVFPQSFNAGGCTPDYLSYLVLAVCTNIWSWVILASFLLQPTRIVMGSLDTVRATTGR